MPRLLDWLLDALFPPRDSEALVRAMTLPALLELLGPTPVATFVPPVVALLPYRARPVKALIAEAKYKGNARAQLLLGEVLAEYLREWSSEEGAFESGPIVLVPLPLSRERERARGYNQAERIIQAALAQRAPELGLDTGVLVRVRDTVPQTLLGRAARKENMQGAFAASAAAVDSGATYIVVDDVITTGATLQAACAALAEAGASRVVPLALAH